MLLEWTGFTREQLLGGRRFVELLTAGGRIYHETHYAPLLAMQGAVREIAFELRCADGSRLPVLVNSVLARDEDGLPELIRTMVFNATDRKRYERELLVARDRERASRGRAERLQRITAALGTRLAPADIVEALLAELPGLAPIDAAEVVLAGGASAAGGEVRIARRGAGASDAIVWRAVEPGRLPAHFAGVLDDGRARWADEPGAAADIADDASPPLLGVLPIRAGEHAFGAVALLAREADPLGQEDRELLLACALQAAQALDRAALLQHETEVAHVLQRSLLQSVPIDDPRIRVGAFYRPAVQTLEVGGDWHDAFPLGEGRVGLVVGDVVGRGIEAAAAMGQLRSATRALASAGLGGPGQVLAALDRFATGLPLARLATLAYVEVDLDAAAVRYACAGHLPPLLVAPGAAPATLWEGRRLPLGVAPPPQGSDEEGRATLAPGSRLLLYSDGLVERRGETLDQGLDRLVEAVAARRSAAPQELLDGLVRALAEGGQEADDVCALCADVDAGVARMR